MKKLTSLFILFGTIITMNVMYFEHILQIVPRFEKGTIFRDLERVHRDYLTPEGFKSVRSIRYDAGIERHVQHVKCFEGIENACPSMLPY